MNIFFHTYLDEGMWPPKSSEFIALFKVNDVTVEFLELLYHSLNEFED